MHHIFSEQTFMSWKKSTEKFIKKIEINMEKSARNDDNLLMSFLLHTKRERDAREGKFDIVSEMHLLLFVFTNKSS